MTADTGERIPTSFFPELMKTLERLLARIERAEQERDAWKALARTLQARLTEAGITLSGGL